MESANNDKAASDPAPSFRPSHRTAATNDGAANATIAAQATGHGAAIPLHRAKNPQAAAPAAIAPTTLHCFVIAGSV